MHRHTLVLSSWYFPERVIGWQSAVTLLYLDRAEVVVAYQDEVRSPSTVLRVPAVLRMKRSTRSNKRAVRFSRQNVYLRDGFSCSYCGVRLAAAKLTCDHVIPRAQGGRTDWDNIVTACQGCNSTKGNRTPEQSGMYPRTRPARPDHLPVLPPKIDVRTAPVEWHAFCTGFGY